MPKFVQIGRYAFNPDQIKHIWFWQDGVHITITFGDDENSDLNLGGEEKDSFMFWWENYAEVEKVG